MSERDDGGSFFRYLLGWRSGNEKEKEWYPRPAVIEQPKPQKPRLTAQDLRWLRDTKVSVGIKLQDPQ